MTVVRIDPEEMNAASTVLNNAAVELADVGSQLSSCVCCAMPPAVAADINALMSAADALLDKIGIGMHQQAVDVARRGVIAAMDSLAAATGSTRQSVAAQYGVNLAALGVAVPAAATAGGATMTIGGNTSPDFVITNADGSPANLQQIMSVSTLGGQTSPTHTVTSRDGSPANVHLPSVVGGGTNSSKSPWGGMAIAELGGLRHERMQGQIDQIMANPNSSPGEMSIAMNAQGTMGDSISHILAPSRQVLDNEAGHMLTDSEVRSRSYYTLPSFLRDG